MVAGMGATLSAIDVDVYSEIVRGSLFLSSEQVLENGNFNCDVMLGKLEKFIDQALHDGFKGLWASGDMTWEFGPKKDFSKLMEYELGLEKIFHRRKELCGVCQYHQDSLPVDALRQSALVHPSIVVNGTLRKFNPHYLKSPWPASKNTIQDLDKFITAFTGT